MSGTHKAGPWPLGIDNVSDDNALKRDDRGRTIALRDAFNVDITRDGQPERRRGRALTLSLPGMHSLWSGISATFAVAAATLYRITPATATAVCALGSDDPCDYTELNGTVIVANRTSLVQVNATGWRNVGVPNAPSPTAHADAVGGMRAGRYSVAVSYMRGDEEGALSPLQHVAVPEGGGIRLTLIAADPEATHRRIYRTECGGEVLYLCTEVSPALSSYLIGGDNLSADSPTMHLTRMRPGEFVTHWAGRLVVGRGRTLEFSQPMNYGLMSPRHNFVQMPRRMTMVAGVEGGIFVGAADGVYFLRGTDPRTWRIDKTSGLPPVKRCVATINGDDTDVNFGQTGKEGALWLSANGFVIGTNDGNIIPMQANRLRIPLALSGSLAILNRRATAVIQ